MHTFLTWKNQYAHFHQKQLNLTSLPMGGLRKHGLNGGLCLASGCVWTDSECVGAADSSGKQTTCAEGLLDFSSPFLLFLTFLLILFADENGNGSEESHQWEQFLKSLKQDTPFYLPFPIKKRWAKTKYTSIFPEKLKMLTSSFIRLKFRVYPTRYRVARFKRDKTVKPRKTEPPETIKPKQRVIAMVGVNRTEVNPSGRG